MKRMVLIPEERLLRYEERDKQRVGHRDDIMYGGGEDSDEPLEDSLSVEMIVRGIPKTMKSRAEALLAHLKKKGRRYYVGRYGSSPIRRCPYTEIQYFRSGVGCDETP